MCIEVEGLIVHGKTRCECRHPRGWERDLGEGGSRRPLCPPLERKGARSSTPGTETGPLGVEAGPGHIWSSTNAGLSPSLREPRGGIGQGGRVRGALSSSSPRSFPKGEHSLFDVCRGVGDRIFGILCCSRTPSILPLAATSRTKYKYGERISTCGASPWDRAQGHHRGQA